MAGIALLMVVIMIGSAPRAVLAQTATPQPNVDFIDIDGETLALEATVTFGDIALVIVGMLIVTILSIWFTYALVADWLK